MVEEEIYPIYVVWEHAGEREVMKWKLWEPYEGMSQEEKEKLFEHIVSHYLPRVKKWPSEAKIQLWSAPPWEPGAKLLKEETIQFVVKRAEHE